MSVDAKRALHQWITANGKLGAEPLRDDTPIIERRIVSSLQIMELILFIEELSGRPVDVERIQPGTFRSIDTIHRRFFAGDEHAG